MGFPKQLPFMSSNFVVTGNSVQTQAAWNSIDQTLRNTYQIHDNNCAHFFIFHVLQKNMKSVGKCRSLLSTMHHY